jgi:hypothetical protein
MADLGTVIPEYLRAAESDRVPAPDGNPYTPAGLRSMRRALDHGAAEAGGMDHAAVAALDERSRARLAWQIVDDAGLPPTRLVSIVEALGCLSAYTPQSAGPPADRPRAAPSPKPALEPSTPTFTMLALGAHVSAWMERIIVIAFVLTAIGLALELL